jgi:hypothetical protein
MTAKRLELKFLFCREFIGAALSLEFAWLFSKARKYLIKSCYVYLL